MDIDQSVYILKSENGNGPEFTIPKDSVGLSVLLSDLEGDDAIGLNFSARTLQKVVEYLMKYKSNSPPTIEKPLKSSNLRNVVSEWDADFVNIDNTELLELIKAAHLLGIQPLLDLCGAKISSLIDRKSSEEIRTIFSLPTDLTPEEDARAKEELHFIRVDEVS